MKIDGEYLHFSDDILTCANIQHEIQQMLLEFADETENQGLKMDKSKTKGLLENDTPIYVNNTQIENVESYIYLRQRYSITDNNQDNEIQRRITGGWTAFANQATSSRATLKHARSDKSTTHAYFQL